MADDGAGATLTFATSTATFDITSVQGQGVSRESLPTFHHGTTGGYKTFMPADFKDPGTVTVSWLYDPNEQPTIGAAAETITITYPVPSGDVSGATEASSGFWSDWDAPEISIDQVMIATGTIKRSGVISYTTST